MLPLFVKRGSISLVEISIMQYVQSHRTMIQVKRNLNDFMKYIKPPYRGNLIKWVFYF